MDTGHTHLTQGTAHTTNQAGDMKAGDIDHHTTAHFIAHIIIQAATCHPMCHHTVHHTCHHSPILQPILPQDILIQPMSQSAT